MCSLHLSSILLALPLTLLLSQDGILTHAVSHGRFIIYAGDNVTLPCASTGKEEEVKGIYWYKGDNYIGGQVPQDTESTVEPRHRSVHIQHNHSLFLLNLAVLDTANYTCKLIVTNISSTEERNITLELIVQDVPSPPGRPILEDIRSRQMTISWLPSDYENNSPVTNYTVLFSTCNLENNRSEIAVASSVLRVTVDHLQPSTCYTFQVRAQNIVGFSQLSPERNDSTKSERNETDFGPPSVPQGFQAISPSSTEIHATWQSPQSGTEKLKGYKITFSHQDSNSETIYINDSSTTEWFLKDLSPYTWYTVSILAYNEAGDGSKAELAVQTMDGLPSSPRITHITGRDSTSFYVHWEPPKKLNGRLVSYELHWIMDDNTTKTRIISGHLTNPMSAFITGLRPYTEYKIQVAACTNGGQGTFSEKYPALTDVAAPSAPYIRNVTVLTPNSVYLQWDPPSVFFRRIDKYVIKWWDTRGNDPDSMVPGTQTEHILRGLPTNLQYKLKIAGATEAIFNKQFLIGEFTAPVTFILGVESMENMENNVIRDIIGGSIHDPNVEESKEDRLPKEIIAGVTCAIIIVIVAVIAFIGYREKCFRSYACRKCYQAAYFYLAVPSNAHSTPPTVVTVAEPEGKEYPEIPVSEFPAHVEAMHVDSDFAFSQEFDDLLRHTRTDFKCEASNSAENRNKNRYINIAAFDHSRVILKSDLGRLRQSDYINANYVDGYQKSKAYIATQGPLPQTFADFWRMVWEQNCSVIVMITNLMEKGRRKCDQYWPVEGMETYGSTTVKLINTVQRAHYTVNTFSLRCMKRHSVSVKGLNERTVYQYHYTEWPDHGVPDYTLPVLEFVQKSAACNPPDGGPIVVHCSAGVGRTGTYILIDSMIRQIQDQHTINIPGFTLHIRRQRNLLVQTEDQYMFIHDVLVEYLMGGGQTEILEDNIISYVASLSASANGVASHHTVQHNCNTLENQYKLVTSFKPSEEDISCACKPVNVEKNRSMDIVPVNLKRVVLPARPGVEGSDYINATYLQGHKKSDEFIVTQYPLESTKDDFWRMVWDRNSPIIIVLCLPGDEEMPEFWPERGTAVEVDAGNFKLVMKDDPVVQLNYIIRDFILESIQYDYIFMTKVVVVTDWCSLPPSHSIFSLVEQAIEWNKANDIGPVIVMDRFGGMHAGRFCALWTLREQLLIDRAVDVYQLAKLYHLKRPGIIGGQDDLHYLYEALSCLQVHQQEESSSVSSSPRHQSSIRKNGTLPRSSTIQSNSAKTETNI